MNKVDTATVIVTYIFNTDIVAAILCTYTVLRIIKLNLFPVPVRLHSGSGKLIFRRYFTTFFIFKIVVHSLEPVETPSHSCVLSIRNRQNGAHG